MRRLPQLLQLGGRGQRHARWLAVGSEQGGECSRWRGGRVKRGPGCASWQGGSWHARHLPAVAERATAPAQPAQGTCGEAGCGVGPDLQLSCSACLAAWASGRNSSGAERWPCARALHLLAPQAPALPNLHPHLPSVRCLTLGSGTISWQVCAGPRAGSAACCPWNTPSAPTPPLAHPARPPATCPPTMPAWGRLPATGSRPELPARAACPAVRGTPGNPTQRNGLDFLSVFDASISYVIPVGHVVAGQGEWQRAWRHTLAMRKQFPFAAAGHCICLCGPFARPFSWTQPH